jgi:hypothetical protein
VSRKDFDDMDDSKQYKRASMKDMPAEFYLPPQSNAALWRETRTLDLAAWPS